MAPAAPAGRAPLPPTVRALGTASLLNDASSEFLYPFLPVFLTSVLGASRTAVGLVEGCAEAAATAAKFAAGPLALRLRRRRPLLVLGYGAAALSRPLLALVPAWGGALALRVADRLGKGLRGPPRDALIAVVTPPADRGRAFGFRASMDHAGAVAGALLGAAAGALLLPDAADPGFGGTLRWMLLLGALPAFLALPVILRWVSEAPPAPSPSKAAGTAAPLPADFRRCLLAMGIFALGNSSDAFLLLRAGDLGVPLRALPLLWAAHHLVKMGLAWFSGGWSDRVGRRPLILAGWISYAAVYAGFALAETATAAVALFLAYGLYHGFAEGVEKALVADLVPLEGRDRAYSLLAGVTGAAALPASLGAGLLWESAGAGAALGAGAGLALLAAAVLATMGRRAAR